MLIMKFRKKVKTSGHGFFTIKILEKANSKKIVALNLQSYISIYTILLIRMTSV